MNCNYCLYILQASLASRKLHELEHGQDKSLKEAKVTASRYQNEAEQLTQRLTNAETEMAELRRDHTSEAAGFATSKRELEVYFEVTDTLPI